MENFTRSPCNYFCLPSGTPVIWDFPPQTPISCGPRSRLPFLVPGSPSALTTAATVLADYTKGDSRPHRQLYMGHRRALILGGCALRLAPKTTKKKKKKNQKKTKKRNQTSPTNGQPMTAGASRARHPTLSLRSASFLTYLRPLVASPVTLQPGQAFGQPLPPGTCPMTIDNFLTHLSPMRSHFSSFLSPLPFSSPSNLLTGCLASDAWPFYALRGVLIIRLHPLLPSPLCFIIWAVRRRSKNYANRWSGVRILQHHLPHSGGTYTTIR